MDTQSRVHTAPPPTHTQQRRDTFAQYQMITLYVLSELRLLISSEERVLSHFLVLWLERRVDASVFWAMVVVVRGDKAGLSGLSVWFPLWVLPADPGWLPAGCPRLPAWPLSRRTAVQAPPVLG